GIFRHGEKEAPRSWVKALNFCASESRGELQDFALNKLKGIEDEIIIKLKSTIKEIVDGDVEFSLLVNLKRLDDLQLSRQISIESLHKDLGETNSQKLLNLANAQLLWLIAQVIGFLLPNVHMHVRWNLHSIINSGTRSALFEILESFLTTKSPEGLRASLYYFFRTVVVVQENNLCILTARSLGVFSQDKAIYETVENDFITIYVRKNPEYTAKNLLNLTIDSNIGDLASLEFLIGPLISKGDLTGSTHGRMVALIILGARGGENMKRISDESEVFSVFELEGFSGRALVVVVEVASLLSFVFQSAAPQKV
ncbi:hypothetical protein H5410_027677, partial [Solanum commersonii]